METNSGTSIGVDLKKMGRKLWNDLNRAFIHQLAVSQSGKFNAKFVVNVGKWKRRSEMIKSNNRKPSC